MKIGPNRAALLFCLILAVDLVSVYGLASLMAISNALIPTMGEPLPKMYSLGGKLTMAGKWLLPVALALAACFTAKTRPLLSLSAFIAYLLFVYVGASLWPIPEYTVEFQEFVDQFMAETTPIYISDDDPQVMLLTHPYWFSAFLYITAGFFILYVIYARFFSAPNKSR